MSATASARFAGSRSNAVGPASLLLSSRSIVSIDSVNAPSLYLMRRIRRGFRPRRRIWRMKTKSLLTLSVLAVGALFATSAQAGWSVGVTIGGPAYYPPPRVVYCPPRPVCPPPVVYYPPPRAVCPPVVYAPPRHGWGRHDYDRHHRYGWDRYNRDDRRGRDRHGRH